MKTSRQLEQIYKIFLHGISIIFAYFLLQGGELIIKQLPRVSVQTEIGDYHNKQEVRDIDRSIHPINLELEVLSLEQDELEDKISGLEKTVAIEKEKYKDALSSRDVIQGQKINYVVEDARKKLEKQQNILQEINQDLSVVQNEISRKRTEKEHLNLKKKEIFNRAKQKLEDQKESNILKAFLIRLLFVLPLLLLSCFLFMKYRKSNSWPFVNGMGYFSIYAFFIELVPYFPSYGGYVRAFVGIILTFVIGRFTIQKLQLYLEQKKKLEKESPDNKRTKLQSEDTELEKTYEKLRRQICPSCDRKIRDNEDKFCIYCGLCFKENCTHCNQLQNSFNKFCFGCGTQKSIPDAR